MGEKAATQCISSPIYCGPSLATSFRQNETGTVPEKQQGIPPELGAFLKVLRHGVFRLCPRAQAGPFSPLLMLMLDVFDEFSRAGTTQPIAKSPRSPQNSEVRLTQGEPARG